MISKSALALAGFIALLWAGSAFAQTNTITTNCPAVGYTCGFSSAETRSLSSKAQAPQQAGAPDVYVGYLAVNPDGTISVSSIGMINGTISNATMSGTCSKGTSGAPATIDFSGGFPQWKFVTVNSAAGNNGEELDFIQSQDVDGTPGTANAVRVGVCRSPAP